MADAADSTFASSGQFALTIADLNTTVDHEPRVSHKRLAQALGYADERKLLRLAERHREALLRFGEISATVAENKDPRGRGRPGRIEWYNKRQVLYLCAKSELVNGTEVTIQMVEVFDAHLSRSLPRPDPELAALNDVLVHEMPAGDFAFMRIGRRTVMLDTKRYRPGPDDEAVVVRHDGRITITKVRDGTVPNWLGARCAAEKWRRPGKHDPHGAKKVSAYVQVLGVVIRPPLPTVTGEGRDAGSKARPSVARPPTPRRRGAAVIPTACRSPMTLPEAPRVLH